MLRRECTHLDQIADVKPSAQGCEECLKMGDSFVHLRECLICGHVGCCDSSVSLPIRNSILFRATLSPDRAASYSMASTVAA
jgi:hypothetical protein